MTPISRRPQSGLLLPLCLLPALLCLVPATHAMDLDTAYQKALEYDSELAAAEASRDVAAAITDLSESSLLPQVGISGTAAHTDTNPGNRPDDSYRNESLQIGVTQPLLAFDRSYGLDASEFGEQAAEEDFRSAELDLVFRTSQAYFNVLRAMDDLETTRRAEEAFRRQGMQAKERFDVGLIAITDVFESRATYDSAIALRIGALGQVDIAVEALSRITGDFVEQIHPLGENIDALKDALPPLPELEQIALRNSPVISSARNQVESARANVDAQHAGHYPTLDLRASYGYSDFTGPSIEDDQTDAVVALDLNVPIWLGGSTQAAVRQARAQLRQTEQNLLTTQRNVRLQLRTLYSLVRTDIQTIEARRQETISNESALEATRAGYDVGTRNIVEVLDAERQYFQSLSNYANSRYDFILNLLSLQQTLGLIGDDDILRLNDLLTAAVPIYTPPSNFEEEALYDTPAPRS